MAAQRPVRAQVNPEYQAFSKALKKPGMQKGEKEQLAIIAAKRGVSVKEAKAIAVKRTSEGRNVGSMRRGVQTVMVEGTTTGERTTRQVTMRKPGTKGPKKPAKK